MATFSSQRKVVQRLMDCWQSGQLSGIGELLTQNFVRHGDYIGEQKEVRGVDEYKRIVADFRKLLTDFHTELVDVIEQGDRIAFRFRTSGKHNGQPITFEGVNVVRFEGDRIAEDWIYYDATGLAAKLGPERAAA
jgi:ketosteroid isomerase-like protein